MISSPRVPKVILVLLLQALAAVHVKNRNSEKHNRDNDEHDITHNKSSAGELQPVKSAAGSQGWA
jgi:hypothetical protein